MLPAGSRWWVHDWYTKSGAPATKQDGAKVPVKELGNVVGSGRGACNPCGLLVACAHALMQMSVHL